MSTFEGDVLNQTIGVARGKGIDAAALLAVVEVESAGKSLEGDGKTPRLLFERHVFYRELKSRSEARLQRAVNAGLAIPKWSRATQYKDQGTSAGRLALFAKAKEIDEEAAIHSCSWGVGQTMGFLHDGLGFATAKLMLDFMVKGGVPAQVECMVREIERRNMIPMLNAHQWAKFARAYNGAGYAQNAYDSKIAAAYERWKVRVESMPTQKPKPVEVPPLQQPGAVKPEKKPSAAPGVGASIAAAFAASAAFIAENRVAIIVAAIFAMIFITLAVVTSRRLSQDESKTLRGVLSEEEAATA